MKHMHHIQVGRCALRCGTAIAVFAVAGLSITGCEKQAPRNAEPVETVPGPGPAPAPATTSGSGAADQDEQSDEQMSDAGDDDRTIVPQGTMVGEGLRFTPDAAWVSSRPASSMRFAQFSVPAGEDDAFVELVVFYFGNTGAGPIEANITRWLGQIAQPDGSDTRAAATIEQRTLNGLATTTIDVTGTYVAETTPGSGVRLNEPDYRLVAAIVNTDAGPYYFKLTGPQALVEQCLDSYEAMLETIAPAGVTGNSDAAGHPG